MKPPHDDPSELSGSDLHRTLSALPRESAPPPWLEDRILRALDDAGAIRRHGAHGLSERSRRRLALAALLVIGIGVGLGAGLAILRPAPPAAESAMRSSWILLLYEDENYRAPAAGRRAERVSEYSAWARRLESTGALDSAGELSGGGTLLARVGAGVVGDDGVPTSDHGVVAGYFVIRAASRQEAFDIATDCPHLRHGGRISLRAIASN
jgi:hypothetical protein